MDHKHLSTYLNDHLAGSVAAIELLEHLAEIYADTEEGVFAAGMRDEILADRKVLEQLMAELDISQSKTRQVSAWVAEKLSALKMRFDDPSASSFRFFESMEAVSLGLEGQRSLWRALKTISEHEPALRRLDYDHLMSVAEDQRSRVEAKRLEAAVAALSPVELR